MDVVVGIKRRLEMGDIVKEESESEEIETLLNFIKQIRFGSVIVSVQDGKIVQIEKSEKVRFR